jgi:integrase
MALTQEAIMAMLSEKYGLIRDRSKGVREISYYIPKTSRTYMRACKEAHETICRLLTQSMRNSLASKELRSIVLQFVELDERGRQALLCHLLYPSEQKRCLLPELMEKWKEGKMAEGHNEKVLVQCKRTLLDFFNTHNLVTADDFAPDTAHKFIAWRTNTSYGNGSKATSASTIKKDLDMLKQIAKLAALHGYITNGNLWETVRVKAIAGKNKKVVEPLSIQEQRNLLRDLRIRNEACHDVALFLLVTGIRRGELEYARAEGNVITLHGTYVGKCKTTGKTSSANRNIPMCPTVRKLFERGNILNTSANALRLALGRHFPGVHLHRFRHTFAVNKLLAQTPLQMVSYLMGHAGTAITSDQYGKFVPEHFKAGFEEAIAERKELLQWLETDYFTVF